MVNPGDDLKVLILDVHKFKSMYGMAKGMFLNYFHVRHPQSRVRRATMVRKTGKRDCRPCDDRQQWQVARGGARGAMRAMPAPFEDGLDPAGRNRPTYGRRDRLCAGMVPIQRRSRLPSCRREKP